MVVPSATSRTLQDIEPFCLLGNPIWDVAVRVSRALKRTTALTALVDDALTG